MLQRAELVSFLDSLFADAKQNDVSNNGLQAEGRAKIRKIAFAVDACVASFQAALEAGADFLFCHHGISWGGGIARFTRYQALRLKLLLANGLSLYAQHLPLDAHPVFGNNAVLAEMVGLLPESRMPFGIYHGNPIGIAGELPAGTTLQSLATLLDGALATNTKIYANHGKKTVHSLAIVSGGGASLIDEAAEKGYDCLLTGEIGHQNYHYAREQKLSLLVAGHYATETTGPKALLKVVQKRFPDVPCVWLDLPTGL